MQIFKEIVFYLCAGIIFLEIFKGNVAVAIIAAAVLCVDYHMWLRGGSSFIFVDKTQIEKDLREIQELETKNKLEELRGFAAKREGKE